MFLLDLIDDKTLIIVQTLFEIIVASIFLITIPIYNKSYLNVFKYGFLLRGLGFLLIGLRGNISIWMSVILANSMLQAGFFINVYGLLLMLKKRVKMRWLIGVFAIHLLLFLNYTFLTPNVGIRIIVFNSIRLIPVVYLVAIYVKEFLKVRDYFTGSILGLYLGLASINVLRIYQVVTSEEITALFRGAWVLKLTLLYTLFFSFLRVYVIFLHVAKEYQDELKSVNTQLEKLSYKDNLTGINNNRAIMSITFDEVERGVRYGHKTAIALIDIDNFKHINDTYGHVFGDDVLKTLAETFTKNIRKSDAVGRYGGEEFLIVLPETTKEDGQRLLERIKEEVKSIIWEKDDSLVVSFSAGIYDIDKSTKILDVRQLIDVADRIMYKAKKNGKDRVEMG